MFYNEDPRRLQPLMDFVLNAFRSIDFNGESSFEALKALSLFRAVYEELNWKFSAWVDEVLDHCWPQIHSEHDDVIIQTIHSTSALLTIHFVSLGSCLYWRDFGIFWEN